MWFGIIALGFGIGTILGSLAQALAERSIKETGFWGRSYCLDCHHILSWYDLFPILSFLVLRGKCRYCHKPIPSINLWIEILMGVLISLVFSSSLNNLGDLSNLSYLITLVFRCFVVTVLLIVLIVDFKVGLIPDRIIFPAVLLTLAFLVLTAGIHTWFTLNVFTGDAAVWNYVFTEIWSPVAVAIITSILSAASFIFLIVITRGRGMGWGDVKFVLFLGLVLSFPNTIVAIFLAFFLGAIASIFLILSRLKHLGQTVPFGPFLSLGAYLALLWGSELIALYLQRF